MQLPVVKATWTGHINVAPAQVERAFRELWPHCKPSAAGVYQSARPNGYTHRDQVFDTYTFRSGASGGTDVTYRREFHSLVVGPPLFPAYWASWQARFVESTTLTRCLERPDKQIA